MHKKRPPQGILLGSTRHFVEELVNSPISTPLGNSTAAAGKRYPLLGKNLLCTQSARELSGIRTTNALCGDTTISDLLEIYIHLCFENPHRYLVTSLGKCSQILRWGNSNLQTHLGMHHSITCWATILTLLGKRILLRWGQPMQSIGRISSSGDAEIPPSATETCSIYW